MVRSPAVMYASYIRGRSLLNWAGLFLTFILIVLFYTFWLDNKELTSEASVQPLPDPTPKSHTTLPSFPLPGPEKVLSDVPLRRDGMMMERVLSPGLSCFDRVPQTRREVRGDYWVLYNFVRPHRTNVACDESITYTTHGDYTFNNNLEPLLRRWRGPVSMALYTPGWDFYAALKSIFYFRNCVNSSLVKEFVSFHLYFDINHLPVSRDENEEEVHSHIKDFESEIRGLHCKTVLEELSRQNVTLYKQKHKLDYPVNVGRNIARLESATHFIFPSDVELYPSPGLIPAFLSMIKRNSEPALHRKNPRVFVSSIFEVKKSIRRIPETKEELLNALDSGDAIPFHQKVCSLCHNIPNSQEWRNRSIIQDEMRIFHSAKRVNLFKHWEPIYIGTNEEPLYDERLSWEGRSDKMTQGYQLCLQDYDFHILNNAFLIHRPGIKVLSKVSKKKSLQIKTQNDFIRLNISKEFDVLFGRREGCQLY